MPNWYLPQLVDQIQTLLGADFTVNTELPPNQTAWAAIPVFGIAKQQGRPLPEVAEEVARKLRTIADIKVSVAGGFVNISPIDCAFVLEQASTNEYGSTSVGEGQKVLVEFPGINVAKPMGIGHLRSTIIGDSLTRILRSQGYTVQTHNYLGNWGTQFGKVLVAYQRAHGDLVPRAETTIKELLDLYVGFHTDAKEQPELEDQAQEMFKRLEAGDEQVRTLWQQLVTISLTEMYAIFDRLGGIHLDYPEDGEAFYEPYLNEVISLAKEQGIAEASEGALIVRIPDEEAPLMLQKSNGTTTYATRDLAQVRYRVNTFHPSKILYCVANEQALHFRQYYAAARLLGFAPDSVELTHIKFGLLRLPEGKMSTRQGTLIFLEDVLDEAVKRTRAVVDQKNPDLPDEEKQHIAEVVGIGALKYFDLSHDRNHDIVFDWDRMLNLSGDSAPYLQYSYVRAHKILGSAGELSAFSFQLSGADLPHDIQQLIRTLAQFPLVIERAAKQYTPHVIAGYLNKLASEFSSFYENYPVLKAEGDDRDLRLSIVAGVANVLKKGLDLLGIDVVETM